MARDITILTPTLNAERWLPGCIRSVASQTVARDRIQHLVLDGGSRDATVPLARASGCDVDVARDGSLYEALNRGIARAEGPIIGWLNADDTFESDAIERVLGSFARSDAEVVFGHYAHATGDRVKLVRTRADALARVRAGVRRTMWITPLSTFFRAPMLRALGPYVTGYRIAADLDMWLRLAAREPPVRTAHTGSVIGTFRAHESSLSAGSRIEPVVEETLRIARSWSEEPSCPPGVRRHALYLARLNAVKLVRAQSRGRGVRARVAAVLEQYRELTRAGPQALWDVRGELYALLVEIAGSAVRRRSS